MTLEYYQVYQIIVASPTNCHFSSMVILEYWNLSPHWISKGDLKKYSHEKYNLKKRVNQNEL